MFLSNGIMAAWDIGTVLQNSTSTLKTWGNSLIILIGVVMVIAAVYQAAKALMSHGQAPVSWPKIIVLLILGGAFMAGGFIFVSGVAEGGKTTIEQLGEGGAVLMAIL